MREQKIVVIGASAGGVEALLTIVPDLPANIEAPVFVVLHIPADSPSLLAQILSRRGEMPARNAVDGEKYRNGVIYVAPPDVHLLIEKDGRMRTPRGPRENRHRPAIDPLSRSAAVAAGENVVAVILTGSLDDGTAGAVAVKHNNGILIVQDPDDAMYPAMPKSAIEHVEPDYCVPLQSIAATIIEAVGDRSDRGGKPRKGRELMEKENKISHMDPDEMHEDERPGIPSAYSCPDCGGVLFEIDEDDYVRYRCRVGHAYSPETMLSAQTDLIEEALWSALKTLQENARLSHRLAAAERERGHDWMARRFEERENDARKRAEVIRQFLSTQAVATPVDVPEPS